MAFSIHSIYRQIFKIWRKKRARLFADTIKPQKHEIVLDVGGYPDTWTTRPQEVLRIDCLNVHPVNWRKETAPNHNIETLVGDGRALDFPDASYDIAFSNSVIEHVGDFDRQLDFASEVGRVGKKLWIQTPAFECPIEPHYLAAFVHWLPKSLRKLVVRWATPWGWIERPSKDLAEQTVETTRLIKRREMSELFPDCVILTERLLFIFPKSYIAVREATPDNGAERTDITSSGESSSHDLEHVLG